MSILRHFLRSAFLCTALSLLSAHTLAAQEQAAPASSKKTVAVVDFSAKSLSVVIGSGIQDYKFSSQYIELMNSELMTSLVNDPTFNVIDRARLMDLAKNGELASVTPSSMAELGRATGADYIVCGDVELLEIDSKVQQFPGMSQTQLSGRMVVNLRIVEVATSRIIHAQKVTDLLIRPVNEYKSLSIPAFLEELKSDVVKKLVTSISENISPIQIVAVHGDKVYLDRGSSAFQGGEILEIVIEVDKIYDKEGNILDAVEEHAGRVRVDTVRQKVAIATVIEQDRPLQEGWIARRILK
ncbi:MAG TPA: CsgG/HfaB family protein [Opitutales bacterium]|nr:CsgG/HfaB family protein [Opitutales bacterium]